ncbi:SDR family NAD(P)-dependent oxidoreductase [Streptomyces fractus]|uniref:SDR family NAD(P)-dependent oxidoreductase n=1 Tax=Streptomyces fractus TaxID=641806 RepID=UPI003CE97223
MHTDPSAVPRYPDLLRLDGRNLVVVGAGQGMGRQTSHALARCVDSGTRGTMVFIASVHGLTASVRHGAYGAAKAGLISWVRTLGDELGGHGIRVNAIAPGVILTPRIMAANPGGARQNATSDLIPPGRMGLPLDIASAALFPSCGLSGYVTGQTVVVDGGVTVKDLFPRS